MWLFFHQNSWKSTIFQAGKWTIKSLYLCNEIEFTIVIYRINGTYNGKETYTFSMSLKIDANYRMYSFYSFLEPLFFQRYISSTIETYTFLHGKYKQKITWQPWKQMRENGYLSSVRYFLAVSEGLWTLNVCHLRIKNEPSSLFSPAITTIRLKLPVSLMNLGLSGRNASTVPTSDPSTTGPQGFPTDPGWKQNI